MAIFSFNKKTKAKEEKTDPKSIAPKQEVVKSEFVKKVSKKTKGTKSVAKPIKTKAVKATPKKSVKKVAAKKTLPAKVSGRATKILINPIVSEKSTLLQGVNQYVFRVAPGADKISIRKAVQDAYGVSVGQVRIQKVKSKKRRFRFQEGRTRSWKKAIVTVDKGEKIDIFSQV